MVPMDDKSNHSGIFGMFNCLTMFNSLCYIGIYSKWFGDGWSNTTGGIKPFIPGNIHVISYKITNSIIFGCVQKWWMPQVCIFSGKSYLLNHLILRNSGSTPGRISIVICWSIRFSQHHSQCGHQHFQETPWLEGFCLEETRKHFGNT